LHDALSGTTDGHFGRARSRELTGRPDWLVFEFMVVWRATGRRAPELSEARFAEDMTRDCALPRFPLVVHEKLAVAFRN
jgi:hypothetical protein